MRVIADLHIHSKYARATSSAMNIPSLALAAKKKGITILGTGDFTHPEYFKELKRDLTPSRFEGFYENNRILFTPSSEIACIYATPKGCKRIHLCFTAPSLDAVEQFNDILSKRGNLKADGRPILGISVPELTAIAFSVSKDFMVFPAHVWTPWFGALGSESGYDSLAECFGDQWKNIYALETGLSSDPEMNWRVSELDHCIPISNSDAHSTEKIGREANVFEFEEKDLSYKNLLKAIKEKDKSKFKMTVEFFPEEGKYHWDGHRAHEISMLPKEAIKLNNICPVCKKQMTLGVLHRVEALADRPEGFIPADAAPFKRLVPLNQIIAEAVGKGVATKSVHEEYDNLIAKFNSEFDILTTVSASDLREFSDTRITEGILRVREGKLKIEPGYDGEYGRVCVFCDSKKEKKQEIALTSGQKSLGEF